jgi:hypothetical protein
MSIQYVCHICITGVIKVAWHDNGLGGLSPVVCRSPGIDEDLSSNLASVSSTSQYNHDGLVLSDSDEDCPNRTLVSR